MKKVGHTSEFPFGIYWWTFKNLKNQNFEKMKRYCWRCHHFTRVPKTTITWGTVPEIQREKILFDHFGSFFALYPNPPSPLTIQKTKILKKNEQSIWRCHHLNLRNKKHDQINDVWLFRYGVWQTCFVILGHFLLFYPTTPPNNLENQHFKKMKKPGDIISHMSTISNINQNHIMYDSWNIHGTWQTEFLLILDHFLPFYTSPLPP